MHRLIHKHEIYMLNYLLELYERHGVPFKCFGWAVDDAKRGDNYELADAYQEMSATREAVVGAGFLAEVERREHEKARKRRKRG